VAEVLNNAQGICQLCHQKAPFIKASNGTPYLEVHHWISLSEGGEDSIENAVALCPNCHKRAHFGKDKDKIKKTKALQ
jgi:5-methylcytosine-specific restriction protein A